MLEKFRKKIRWRFDDGYFSNFFLKLSGENKHKLPYFWLVSKQLNEGNYVFCNITFNNVRKCITLWSIIVGMQLYKHGKIWFSWRFFDATQSVSLSNNLKTFCLFTLLRSLWLCQMIREHSWFSLSTNIVATVDSEYVANLFIPLPNLFRHVSCLIYSKKKDAFSLKKFGTWFLKWILLSMLRKHELF